MKSEKEILIEIGLRFEKLRKNKGFTSYEHFANEYNLSRMHYWKIEKGKANITIKTLTHILNIHNCSIETFFKLPINNEQKNINSNTKNNFFVLLFIFFCSLNSFSQNLFYQDLCHCGVTGAGFSTQGGSGSGSFNIYIESGSIIKKAYLFALRLGEADSVSIIINGVGYNFNNNNQVTSNYFINATGNSAIHVIDVTANINPAITNYNITIPSQTNTTIPPNPTIADANIRYRAIYLWVEYEKTTLPLTNGVILLNNFDMNNSIINYQTDKLAPISINNPIGFSIYSDNIGDTLLPDGSYIYI